MLMKKFLSFALFVFIIFPSVSLAEYGIQTKTSNCLANQNLPDSKCTPGAILTKDIKTICKSGYTKTVRDVTLNKKKKVFAEYGIAYSNHGNYEVDHLVSLELGGSNDISNLWPESHSISNGSFTKDKFENWLHSQVCSGKMTIQEAQNEIASDWVTFYLGTQASSKTTKTKSVIITPILVTGPEIKKSLTGICHQKGTRYYEATTHYTPYDSLDKCLSSGGRLPK